MPRHSRSSFEGHELTVGEWEKTQSEVYKALDQYQKDGYAALMKIAQRYSGAFLCDGVGLGKTFVGLMLIERLVMYERKRVVLLVPKAAREAVWGKELRRYLPNMEGTSVTSRSSTIRTCYAEASMRVVWSGSRNWRMSS